MKKLLISITAFAICFTASAVSPVDSIKVAPADTLSAAVPDSLAAAPVADSSAVAPAADIAQPADSAAVAPAAEIAQPADSSAAAPAADSSTVAPAVEPAAEAAAPAPEVQAATEAAVAATEAAAAAQAASEAGEKAAKSSNKKASKKSSKKDQPKEEPAAQPAKEEGSPVVAAAAPSSLAEPAPAPAEAKLDEAAVAQAAEKAAEAVRAEEKEAALKREAELAKQKAMEAEAHKRELKKAEREGRRTIKGRRYKFFNHLGVGLVSGLDGIGFDVALPIYGHLQLRGGYSFIPKFGVDKKFDLGTYEVNGTDRDFDNIAIKLRPAVSQAHLFLDLYPSRWAAFHLTVGAYYGISSPNFVEFSADLSHVLQPDEYASVYVQLDDADRPGKYARVSTDEKGFAHISLRPKQEIIPYLGLGFGRGANLKHTVSVNFELGVQYIKGMGIEVYDYDGKGQYITSGMLEGKDAVDHPFKDGKKIKIIDTLGEDFNIWPVMRFGINIRLF